MTYRTRMLHWLRGRCLSKDIQANSGSHEVYRAQRSSVTRIRRGDLQRCPPSRSLSHCALSTQRAPGSLLFVTNDYREPEQTLKTTRAFSTRAQLNQKVYNTPSGTDLEEDAPRLRQDVAEALRESNWVRDTKPVVEQEVENIISRTDNAKEQTDGLYFMLQREARKGNKLNVAFLVERFLSKFNEQPNLKLFSALILSNAGPTGSAAEVGALLEEIEENGLVATAEIYHNALKALAVHPDCLLRADILENMRKRWFDLTNVGWHDVVAGHVREGQLEMAFEYLDQMWTAKVKVEGWLHDMMMFSLCDYGEMDEALRLLKHRIDVDEISISEGVWYYVFDEACTLLHHETLDFIWNNRVAIKRLNPTQGQCLAVLTSASRTGDVALSTDVFRVLSERKVTFKSAHYELLMTSYIRIADLKTSLTIPCIMSGAGITITPSTLAPLYQHLKLDSNRLLQSLDLLKEMVSQEGRSIPTPVMTCIIEAAAYHRTLPVALLVYKSLHKLCPSGPDTNVFNALFHCARESAEQLYAKRQMSSAREVKDAAMFLASEMRYLKIRPDNITYDRLLLTCLSQEDPSDAWRYYKEMRSEGHWPRTGTWFAMVKRLKEQADEEQEEEGVKIRLKSRENETGAVKAETVGSAQAETVGEPHADAFSEYQEETVNEDQMNPEQANKVNELDHFGENDGTTITHPKEAEEGYGISPLERAWAIIGTMKERGINTQKVENLLMGVPGSSIGSGRRP